MCGSPNHLFLYVQRLGLKSCKSPNAGRKRRKQFVAVERRRWTLPRGPTMVCCRVGSTVTGGFGGGEFQSSRVASGGSAYTFPEVRWYLQHLDVYPISEVKMFNRSSIIRVGFDAIYILILDIFCWFVGCGSIIQEHWNYEWPFYGMSGLETWALWKRLCLLLNSGIELLKVEIWWSDCGPRFPPTPPNLHRPKNISEAPPRRFTFTSETKTPPIHPTPGVPVEGLPQDMVSLGTQKACL